MANASLIHLAQMVTKPVLSMSDAVVLGHVSAVYFDARFVRARCLEISPASPDQPQRRFVPVRAIRQLEFDAIVLKNADCLTLLWNTTLPPVRCPLGGEVFNQDGLRLGTLDDVLLVDMAVSSIVVGQQSFGLGRILSVGQNVLVLNDTDQRIKIQRTRTRSIPRTAQPDSTITLHDQATPTTTTPGTVDLPLCIRRGCTTVTHTPQTPPGSSKYDFLLQKTTTATIFGPDGSVIIPVGTKIDPSIIDLAREHGRLVHLVLHS